MHWVQCRLWSQSNVQMSFSIVMRADAGPGSTVPEEQLSYGRDSANVSGHTIPAVLHGDQYAVLFDTEPTEDEILHRRQMVTMFDLLELSDF